MEPVWHIGPKMSHSWMFAVGLIHGGKFTPVDVGVGEDIDGEDENVESKGRTKCVSSYVGRNSPSPTGFTYFGHLPVSRKSHQAQPALSVSISEPLRIRL